MKLIHLIGYLRTPVRRVQVPNTVSSRIFVPTIIDDYLEG